MTVRLSPEGRQLKAVWERLPDRVALTEDALDNAILKALGRDRSALADASAIRSALDEAEAVRTRRGEDGRLLYLKAKAFPTWPEQTGPGTASFDEGNKEQAARERADHDRTDAEAWRQSPQARQRADLIALIDERIDARLAELRRASAGAALTSARERRERIEDAAKAALK